MDHVLRHVPEAGGARDHRLPGVSRRSRRPGAPKAYAVGERITVGTLALVVEFTVIHPDKPAHPLVIGGTNRHQIFVGVITELIWT